MLSTFIFYMQNSISICSYILDICIYILAVNGRLDDEAKEDIYKRLVSTTTDCFSFLFFILFLIHYTTANRCLFNIYIIVIKSILFRTLQSTGSKLFLVVTPFSCMIFVHGTPPSLTHEYSDCLESYTNKVHTKAPLGNPVILFIYILFC